MPVMKGTIGTMGMSARLFISPYIFILAFREETQKKKNHTSTFSRLVCRMKIRLRLLMDDWGGFWPDHLFLGPVASVRPVSNLHHLMSR